MKQSSWIIPHIIIVIIIFSWATVTIATAAGASALLYYTLQWRSSSEDENDNENENSNVSNKNRRKSRAVVRLAQAPATWLETIWTLVEAIRFTYSETLGKWPIGELTFGINFLLRRQGHLHVASVYAGEDSRELRGPAIVAELKDLLNLLTMCIHFSKKPFLLFLEVTGYSKEHVLLQEPKAGILKPAFTILIDDKSQSFLLLIRGTHSIKDTLTAVTGAIVPFHHSVLEEGGVRNLVLGYAHCGMVAAARWIAQLATPCLLKALEEYPNYRIKVVGHSLGGGTAALLTYILREQKEFLSTHCISFAPAACMTWDLAESGTPYITSIINGSDLVPTFSSTPVDDLRAEEKKHAHEGGDQSVNNNLVDSIIRGNKWPDNRIKESMTAPDSREQIEQTRLLSTVYHSASAMGAWLPSMTNAWDKVARAGAIWRPVSSSTYVVIKQAQTMAQAVVWTKPSLGISAWSCMGAWRCPVASITSFTNRDGECKTLTGESSNSSESRNVTSSILKDSECETLPISTGDGNIDSIWGKGLDVSYSSATDEECKDHELDEEEEEDIIYFDSLIDHSEHQEISEDYVWHQLEQELKRKEEDVNQEEREEEAAVAKEIIQEEENIVAADTEINCPGNAEKLSDWSDNNRFFPPGKIMHIVSTVPSDSVLDDDGKRAKVGIYLTSRDLYGKMRISWTMINDHYMPIYKKMMEQLISEL